MQNKTSAKIWKSHILAEVFSVAYNKKENANTIDIITVERYNNSNRRWNTVMINELMENKKITQYQ